MWDVYRPVSITILALKANLDHRIAGRSRHKYARRQTFDLVRPNGLEAERGIREGRSRHRALAAKIARHRRGRHAELERWVAHQTRWRYETLEEVTLQWHMACPGVQTSREWAWVVRTRGEIAAKCFRRRGDDLFHSELL